MTLQPFRRKKLEAVDWQAASDLSVKLVTDPVFVKLLRQLRENPTHHNHAHTSPDDFQLAVEGCRRCDAFFELPFYILEHI